MKTKILFYTFLFFTTTFLSISSLQAQCDRVLDSIDLVEIYYAGIDEGWAIPWDLNTPIHKWKGVSVNEMGCVVSLKQDWNKVDINISGGIVSYANFDLICHENDSLALIALYNSTNGSNWTNPWDLSQPINTWYGVTLNENGCVEKLDLDGTLLPNCPECTGYGINLEGTIPIELWTLTSLVELSLSGNSGLNGPISPNIANLSKLMVLSLRNNFLGEVPSEINTLTSLNILILGFRHNSIPDFSSLVNLTHLNLYQFTLDQIPEWIKNLTNLNTLNLSWNNFTSVIPAWIGDLINLDYLTLSHNNLTGELPSSLDNLTKLTRLYLSRNQLQGQLPSYSFLKPRFILLDRNKFTGSIPSWVNNPSTYSICLDENQFSGELPLFSENLNTLELENNQFTFEDLLPNFQGNISRVNNFNFFPQNKIFQETVLTPSQGTNVTIDLLIDENVTSNIYKWYKDGQLLRTINGNNKLIIENISNTDKGVYYCEITNPNVPNLILNSHDITITIIYNCSYEYLDVVNPIPSNVYRVQTIVESSGIIKNGSDVNFIAGNSVTLKAGFYAELGSNFIATVDNEIMCNNLFSLNERNSEIKNNTFIPIENISLNIYPSPFREKATIEYRLPKNQKISLIIYDLAGQIIQQFEQNTIQDKGVYQYELNDFNLNPGMYIVLLQSENERVSKKIILIK